MFKWYCKYIRKSWKSLAVDEKIGNICRPTFIDTLREILIYNFSSSSEWFHLQPPTWIFLLFQFTGIRADVFRFYLLSIRPEGQDSNFSWVDLATRNNSELLNNFGNFVNRAIVFCFNSFNATIPFLQLETQDINLLALINREIKSTTISWRQ